MNRHTLQILWGYCPAEVRTALRPILLDSLWLLPGWCMSLFVRWDGSPEDGDIAAYTSAQPEYRQGQVVVCPGWLASTPAARRRFLVHELMHFPLAPMVEEHRDLAKRLFGEGEAPRFEGYAEEQWRRAFEGTVQDLALAVAMLSGPFPSVPFVEVEDDDGGAG